MHSFYYKKNNNNNYDLKVQDSRPETMGRLLIGLQDDEL